MSTAGVAVLLVYLLLLLLDLFTVIVIVLLRCLFHRLFIRMALLPLLLYGPVGYRHRNSDGAEVAAAPRCQDVSPDSGVFPDSACF